MTNLKEVFRALVPRSPRRTEIPGRRELQDLGIDSMMGVEIVAAIERKAQVKISDDRLVEVTTPNSSMALVQKKLGPMRRPAQRSERTFAVAGVATVAIAISCRVDVEGVAPSPSTAMRRPRAARRASHLERQATSSSGGVTSSTTSSAGGVDAVPPGPVTDVEGVQLLRGPTGACVVGLREPAASSCVAKGIVCPPGHDCRVLCNGESDLRGVDDPRAPRITRASSSATAAPVQYERRPRRRHRRSACNYNGESACGGRRVCACRRSARARGRLAPASAEGTVPAVCPF